MKPDENEWYRISFRQDYPEYQEAIDNYMDFLLECSEYKEAKEVINMVKAKL